MSEMFSWETSVLREGPQSIVNNLMMKASRGSWPKELAVKAHNDLIDLKESLKVNKGRL